MLVKKKLVVVIPVGPECSLDFVTDTIESLVHYVTSSHAIIILDDSGKGIGTEAGSRFNDAVVLKTPRVYGKKAGLYVTLSRGFGYAYENYDFEICLRLDTDALVTGPNPEDDAIRHFKQYPDAGIIGSYKSDCMGKIRQWTWARERLALELSPLLLPLNPFKRLNGWLFLRRVYREAIANGYQPGEHCLGGAYFISRECMGRLHHHGLLDRHDLTWSTLGEDHLFGLFIHAVKLRHADFATGSLPMGLRWRGLPCSPDELVQRNKKVIHSTRFYGDLGEEAIRTYFRRRRTNRFLISIHDR